MTSDQPRSRSARGQGAAVADELIAAAEQLLGERGSADAVTVAEIVRRVGVTAPVLYAHFDDKDALFVAVHARRLRDFRDTLRRAARRAASPMEALERRGRAYVRYATTRREAYLALFMTPRGAHDDTFSDPQVRALTAYDDLLDNVRACIAERGVADVDPDLAARIIWIQVHGLASALITMPEIADGIGANRLIDRLMHVIGASLTPTDSHRPEGGR